MEDVTGDSVADEFVDVFGEKLAPGGLHLETTRGKPPQQDHQQSSYDSLPERLVHPGGGAGDDGSVENEIVDTRRGVATFAATLQRKKPGIHVPLPYRLMIRYVLVTKPRTKPSGSNQDVFQI